MAAPTSLPTHSVLSTAVQVLHVFAYFTVIQIPRLVLVLLDRLKLPSFSNVTANVKPGFKPRQ